MQAPGKTAGPVRTPIAGDLTPLRADRLEYQDPSKDPLQESKRHNTLAGLINMHALSLRSLSGLDTILECTHLFINETDDVPLTIFSDEQPYTESYEILDETGAQILFGVVLINKCCGSVRICPHSFDLKIKDAKGEALIHMDASTRWFGRKRRATVKHRQEIYGILKQEGELCTPDYNLLNSHTDSPILKIRPNGPANCFNTGVPLDYSIFNGEFATIIGKVSMDWSKDVEIPAIHEGTAAHSKKGIILGASFPRVLPVAHKILVLATVFMVRICSNVGR